MDIYHRKICKELKRTRNITVAQEMIPAVGPRDCVLLNSFCTTKKAIRQSKEIAYRIVGHLSQLNTQQETNI